MGNKMDFQEESVSITAPLLALSLINTDPDEFNGLTFGVASSSRLNPEVKTASIKVITRTEGGSKYYALTVCKQKKLFKFFCLDSKTGFTWLHDDFLLHQYPSVFIETGVLRNRCHSLKQSCHIKL